MVLLHCSFWCFEVQYNPIVHGWSDHGCRYFLHVVVRGRRAFQPPCKTLGNPTTNPRELFPRQEPIQVVLLVLIIRKSVAPEQFSC